jgi:hypothetical protein
MALLAHHVSVTELSYCSTVSKLMMFRAFLSAADVEKPVCFCAINNDLQTEYFSEIR